MAEEHLVVGTVGMMMTEEVRTTAKSGMTDTMINHGTPETITIGTIIGVMIEAPSPKDPNGTYSLRALLRKMIPPAPSTPVEEPLSLGDKAC